MSLILEALKKSEARRRLGEAPDLDTPFAATRRRRNPLPFIAAAIVIAAGTGWWLLRTPASHKPAATASIQTQEKPFVVSTTAAHPTPPVAIRATNAPASPPAAATATPEQAPISAWVPMGQGQPRLTGRKRGAMANPTGKPVNSPTPTTAAQAPVVVAPIAGLKGTEAATPAPGVKKPEPPAQTMPLAGVKKPELPAETAPVAGVKKPEPPPATGNANNVANAKNVAAPTPTAAANPGAPSYYELPFSLRKDMPAIKLSMHVFAPEPVQRFIILNGSRMAEGDTQDDLAIREIRPDGVVFEFHGQRLFYPRDGQ